MHFCLVADNLLGEIIIYCYVWVWKIHFWHDWHCVRQSVHHSCQLICLGRGVLKELGLWVAVVHLLTLLLGIPHCLSIFNNMSSLSFSKETRSKFAGRVSSVGFLSVLVLVSDLTWLLSIVENVGDDAFPVALLPPQVLRWCLMVLCISLGSHYLQGH